MKFTPPVLKNDLFFRAIQQEPTERLPVWMMRQAGRTDPEYNDYKARDGRPLEQLFRDPKAAIDISLLPQRFGVDAIIMFQDILTPLTPMGADFVFRPGPVLETPIRSLEQVKALKAVQPEESLSFVAETLHGIHTRLDGALPVLGFAGAPFTLAAFMIVGKSPMQDASTVFAFAEEQPEAFQLLLDKLTEMTITYLNYQIENGAQAVQLFESLGHLISRPFYERYIQPTHEKILKNLSSDAPGILFVRECDYVDLMLQTPAAVLSVGRCVDLKAAKAQAAGKVTFQGNVDNEVLRTGTKDAIQQEILRCLGEGGKQGHILNLNHGLIKDTPFENVCYFVEESKRLSKV